MMIKATALMLWIWASCLAHATAVDCNQQPNFIQAIENCCRFPNMSLDAFKDKCQKYLSNNALSVSPCLNECIFNSSNVFNDYKSFNQANVRLMIQKIFGNNHDFVDIFVEGLQNCTGSADEMLKFIKRRPSLPPGVENCSLLPLMYGVCAKSYSFKHCPTASWSPTANCEKARKYMINCSKMRLRG